MADSTTLQEYVVQLGFKTDDIQFRKFREGIASIQKQVLEFGAALAAAAVSVDLLVQKTAAQFEKLAYASQRTDESVKNISAISAAFQAVGISSEQAQGLVENFANTIRTHPGLMQQLGFLGVKDGSPGQMFVDFTKRMVEMDRTQPFMAESYGRQYGLTEPMIYQIGQNWPVFQKAMADFLDQQQRAGIDPQKDAGRFLEFNRTMVKLSQAITNLETVIAEHLVGPLTDIAKFLAEQIQKLTNGEQSTVEKAGTLAFLAGGTMTAKGLSGWLARRFLGVELPAVGGPALSGAGAILSSPIGAAGAVLASDAALHPLNAGEDAQIGRTKAPDAARHFMEMFGWSKEMAAAVTARLIRESGLSASSHNIDSDGLMHRGLASWSPERQREAEEMFHKPFTSLNWDEQAKFLDYELMRGHFKAVGERMQKLGSASEMYGVFTHDFERPRNASDWAGGPATAEAIASKLRPNVNYSPSTTVNISGQAGQGPHGTVDELMRHLKRIHMDQTRYLQNNAQ